MQSYSLDTNARKRLSRKLTLAGLWTVPLWVSFVAWMSWAWLRELAMLQQGLLLIVAVTCIISVQLFLNADATKTYKVLVDDDAICTLTKSGAKSVRRGHIRTIRETEWGLLLSEEGSWKARLRGSVWLSSELDAYEALKELASSWKDSSTAK